MNAQVPAGEVSTHKTAALFATEAEARAAAAALVQELKLQPAQVQLLGPHSRHPGRTLEPESRGIWQTLLRAHAVLGFAGLVAGLLAFYVLHRAGLPMVTSSPVLSGVVFAFIGAMAGLMLGGLVTLRPDHDPYHQRVLDACREGRHAVVVHGFDAAQRDAARDALARASGDVVSTL